MPESGTGMNFSASDKAFVEFKLSQAREAYEEAEGLFADGAEFRYVVNSLYYAFYYPVLALLHSRNTPAGMQSVSLSLFDKEFVQTGIIEKRFSEAFHRAFDLKPKCAAGALKLITREEVIMLFTAAKEFLEVIQQSAGTLRSAQLSAVRGSRHGSG